MCVCVCLSNPPSFIAYFILGRLSTSAQRVETGTLKHRNMSGEEHILGIAVCFLNPIVFPWSESRKIGRAHV